MLALLFALIASSNVHDDDIESLSDSQMYYESTNEDSETLFDAPSKMRQFELEMEMMRTIKNEKDELVKMLTSSKDFEISRAFFAICDGHHHQEYGQPGNPKLPAICIWVLQKSITKALAAELTSKYGYSKRKRFGDTKLQEKMIDDVNVFVRLLAIPR
jgi:hypothetical protein